MVKKEYTSVWMELDPEDDPVIVIGGSQGTSGYETPYTFVGISEEIQAMIDLNCDDFDLQDMDTDHNYTITLEEFQAWYDANQPW